MKNLAIASSLALLSLSSAQASLLLTAIYDGQSSSPKGIEVYVTSDGSFENWTVELEFNANNGFTTAYTFDATSYTAGDFLYITSTPTDPVLTGLGGTSIIIDDSSFNMNGDDRVRLTDGTNPIDQYGVSGTDGTGEPWEYTDSFATRNSGTSPAIDGDFVIGDWNIRPVNTLDSGNEPLTTDLGTYDPVPEPSVALLGGLGLLGLLRRRR